MADPAALADATDRLRLAQVALARAPPSKKAAAERRHARCLADVERALKAYRGDMLAAALKDASDTLRLGDHLKAARMALKAAEDAARRLP